MKKLLCLCLFLSATVAFAQPKETIRCETKPKGAAAHLLMVTCPPPSDFSPIRVRLALTRIDKHGWTDLDLATSRRVKLRLLPQKILLLLPHREHNHEWKAWRQFKKVEKVTIFQDQGK